MMVMTSPGTHHAPKRMGLLPLEFSDCLLDSPYFRENLRAHEKQLDQTSADIKAIIKDVQDVVDAAKSLSKAKRTLASSLASFQFDCLGTSLTDDEVIIANSLREFSKFLNEVEDEMDRMLEHAHEKFIQPLANFRKEQIGSVKKIKRDFDKATARFCSAQDNYIRSKKEESLAEAAEAVRLEQRGLRAASLEYVYLMHVVQERKKFDFVEALLSFMHSWSNYYKYGHEKTVSSAPYMNDLKSRVQRCRTSFTATKDSYDSLKDKMAHDTSQDPGVFNPMYTRQGYLYVQTKNKSVPFNVVGSQWNKHYCQYQAKSKTLTMIPYSQLNGKITTTETVRVTSCVCKSEDSAEKFRFVVSGDDLTQRVSVSYTIQAMSEFERKHWVEALGGTWPAVNTLQKLRADSVEDNLNSVAFTFLKDCLAELESRGLTDQGLYRVGGVVSKVKKLLNEGLLNGGQGSEKPFDLSDPKLWESKTIASAVKQYFRDLSKPLMTHVLYGSFVEAVKSESETQRLQELTVVMKRLPIANREMLKVLIRHLNRVAAKNETNLMTAANLGVVFGPTLLRPKEETVASIMDIKFCNEAVEILIQNCDTFFPVHSDSSPELVGSSRKSKGKAPPVPDDDHHHVHHSHHYHNREQRGSSTPKRTHSFSSFSQLSTNSLPDIKEFNPGPTVLSIASDAHRMHYRHVHRNESKSTVVKVTTKRKESSPPLRPLIKSASRDDDLMASLEMMNNLAADLPNQNGLLKRSFTVQHRRSNSVATQKPGEVKKPPLPKSSLGSIVVPVSSHAINSNHSDTSSTGSTSSNAFKQVLSSSRMSNSQPVTSGSSPNIMSVYPASPRPSRPKELFVRQITLPVESSRSPAAAYYEETPIVPSPSLATPSPRGSSSNGQVPPPIPARRYPRVYHQISSNTDESEPDQQRPSVRSIDSGILTSPSPPTDSGIAVSPLTSYTNRHRSVIVPGPPDQFADATADKAAAGSKSTSDDTVSIDSTESDTSGSRYDNVPHRSHHIARNHDNNRRCSNDTITSSSKTSTLVAAAAEIAAKRMSADSPTREISTQTILGEDGVDGDDEDEASTDSSSDVIVLDSSSSEGKKDPRRRFDYDEDEDEDEDEEEADGSKNNDEIEISDHFRRRGNSRRKYGQMPAQKRDSGPYDNFVLPGAVLPPPSSVSSSVDTPLSSPSPPQNNLESEEKLEPASIKRLLAAGPTSNV